MSTDQPAAGQPAAASARGAVDLAAFAGGAAAQGTGAGQDPRAAQAPPAPGAAGAPPSGGGGAWARTVGEAEFPELVQLSSTVPVVVSLGRGADPASRDLAVALSSAVDAYGGRLVLGVVDADRSPTIPQAFRLPPEQLPAVVALIKGQPVPMFQGSMPADQLRSLFDELLQLGLQHGVAGTVPAMGAPAAEAPLPPLHQEALEAIDAGDLDRAASAYRQALAEKPNDADAQTGLSQVELLRRTEGADPAAARQAAADNPDGLEEQMAVADLDIVGGHVEDAFARLVALVGRTAGDDREKVRARLVDLFGVVGNQDPRVAKARQALARVLF
jgi:putative thioredoxin